MFAVDEKACGMDQQAAAQPNGGLTVSVVSHGHGELVCRLLNDIQRLCEGVTEVLVTINVEEAVEPNPGDYRFRVELIHNTKPAGFGANHNAAFDQSSGDVFCVVNPDIRLEADPFPGLVAHLRSEFVGVVAPKVVSPEGMLEDSARVFPSVRLLVRKLWSRRIRHDAPEPDYRIEHALVHPDWVAGMFMVFTADRFRRVGGFDERYFLYYEDVDMCWRLRRLGLDVVLVPDSTVVHHAQRASWRSWRHMRWHASSMARFFLRQARG